MKIRRCAVALAAVALAVPAAAAAEDGTATLVKESSTPRLALRVDVVLRTNDPNALAEKVGYELSGLYAVTLLGGLSTSLPDSKSGFSHLGPSAVTADELATLLVGLWDRSTDPTLADAVNPLGGVLAKGHEGVEATLADQLNGIVKMLGLGGATAVPAQNDADLNASMPPGWELYADGDQSADDSGLTPPPLVSIDENGNDTVHNGDGSTTKGDPNEWEDPFKPEPAERAPDAEKVRDAIVDAVKTVKQTAETYTSMPVYIGVFIKGGKEDGTPTMGGMTINFNLPPYDKHKYVDPDATGGSAGVALSPEEIAARLTNELKDPVRPDDTQEAPPGTQQPTGTDPTVEHYDPDATAGTLAPVTDPEQIHATAPIDYHRDAQPLTPGTNPAPTGNDPPHDGG